MTVIGIDPGRRKMSKITYRWKRKTKFNAQQRRCPERDDQGFMKENSD